MRESIVITQGGHAVSGDPAIQISTLLGSCVACCLHDPMAKVGGMNHILLGRHGRQHGGCDLIGVNAMEVLINDLLKLGAMRHRLEAKIFGGAQMVSGLSSIGPENASFVRSYLDAEGITCLASSTGGDAARHLLFWPVTGVARQKMQRGLILDEGCSDVVDSVSGNDLQLF